MINDSLVQSLHSHLAGWGLRQFTSDETYFQWQRETLSPAEITALHRQDGAETWRILCRRGLVLRCHRPSEYPAGPL